MPVTRPLLSCSPFLSFQSALRASGQSCAQCPWFLDNLHFVQPEKSCSPLAHSPHLCAARAAHSASRCGCLGRRNSRGRGEFQCTQLGYWVDVCLAVPASPYFHVGNTNILWVIRFWWCRHIQIDFHTFHFSFLLTFCTCFFFPFFIYFLEPTIYFLEPTIYCLFTFLTYLFNTFATTTWLLKPLSVL